MPECPDRDADLVWRDAANSWHQQLARIVDHRFSTFDELRRFAPGLKVVTYWGAQDERRHLRLQLVQDELDYDIILTTYNMVISSAEDRVLFKKMAFTYIVFDEAHMLKNMASQR